MEYLRYFLMVGICIYQRPLYFCTYGGRSKKMDGEKFYIQDNFSFHTKLQKQNFLFCWECPTHWGNEYVLMYNVRRYEPLLNESKDKILIKIIEQEKTYRHAVRYTVCLVEFFSIIASAMGRVGSSQMNLLIQAHS